MFPNLAKTVFDSLKNTSSWRCISCLVRRQQKDSWFCVTWVLYAGSESLLLNLFRIYPCPCSAVKGSDCFPFSNYYVSKSNIFTWFCFRRLLVSYFLKYIYHTYVKFSFHLFQYFCFRWQMLTRVLLMVFRAGSPRMYHFGMGIILS